jgi:membrane protease YdiL (CAAX protease family)
MAYREKQAWLTLIPMLIAYSIYFPMSLATVRAPLENLLLFGIIAATQGIVFIIGMVILAVRTDAASRKPDERDRAIARRGANIGYYLLILGMIVVGVIMPFTKSGWEISNAALFAIVLAETVSTIVILISYRRGWNG